MNKERKTDFCYECRKETEYSFIKEEVKRTIKGKEYIFSITAAICSECGGYMSLPGLIDKNLNEIGEQLEYYS